MSQAAQRQFARMIKCLELTASDNDAEALLAARKANQLRQALGFTWSALLDVAANDEPVRESERYEPPPEPEPEAPPDDPEDMDYDHVFQAIFAMSEAQLSDKWRGILAGIQDYWWSVGRLSPKQHNLVMRFYRSAVERSGGGL